MNNNLTELVFILDRSGSMYGLEKDTMGGFNSLLEKQQEEPGEALITTILFDQDTTCLHDRQPLYKIKPLTDKDYQVGGCTALLDALGSTLEHIKSIHGYIRPEDVPAKVLFVVTTDGMENASHKYSLPKIKTMVEAAKERGWQFLFLGANIDAIATAETMGIQRDHAVTYQADKAGTKLNYATVNQAIHSYRKSAKIPNDWKSDIEEDMKQRGK